MPKEFNIKSYNNPNSWLGLLLISAVVVVLIVLIRNLYKVFFGLAPIFLILTLILDYRVIAKFGIVLYNLLKHKTYLGILAIIFSLIGLPFVSAAMFFNAFMNFRTKINQKSKFTKYIELEEKKEELKIDKEKEVNIETYEDLFE